MRSFVALINADGYHAVPIVARDLAEAWATASRLAGDVVAVLDQADVAALGMALAVSRAAFEGGPAELEA